jgi:hypothetical protein
MCTDTPSELANIVQYDIRMYFFRRGMENMHQMTKSNFAVKTGMKYVFKTTDEMTKNHRENCAQHAQLDVHSFSFTEICEQQYARPISFFFALRTEE